MKKSKIILYLAYGNHSNRLFQSIHFEAFCKEYNIDFINSTFSDMQTYYLPMYNADGEGRLSFILQKFPLLLKMFRLVLKVKKKLNLINFISFNDEDENNIEKLLTLLSPPRCILVGGWYFRDHELTEKYQDHFIFKYSLKEKYFLNNLLLNKISELKESNKVVVGIHIRRGDYKSHMEGKYYFADNVYLNYMKKIENEIEIKNNKKCTFIIFSNENVSIPESEYTYISKNEWYIDHILMSKCDLLLGPPSTFTMWASYIGKVKYFHIESDNDNIDLDSFKYCIG